MSANVAIPIAGFKDVYDVPTVEKALQRAVSHRERGAAHALREDGAPRRPALHGQALGAAGDGAPVRRAAELHRGARRHPQAPRAVHRLRTTRSSCRRCCCSASPASARRTSRARWPQLLGTGFGFVPMSSLTAGWVLSGASSQWKNAKPGKVFDTFLNGDYANPVIVVDELDKASGDGQYDPARRALRAARDRRPRRASSTSSSSCRSTPPARCGSPPPTTRRASPSRCSTA